MAKKTLQQRLVTGSLVEVRANQLSENKAYIIVTDDSVYFGVYQGTNQRQSDTPIVPEFRSTFQLTRKGTFEALGEWNMEFARGNPRYLRIRKDSTNTWA